MNKITKVIIIILQIASTQVIFSQNTDFQSGSIWKDNNGIHINAHGGGILYFKHTYFWYGEHKIEGTKGNAAWVGVHVYSSKDLYNWTDSGIALPVVKNDSLNEISEGCVLERPKVIYNSKTKKFVMWFHLELRGKGYDAARAGVAIADKPTGPFTYLKSFRPNAGYWPINVQPFHKQPVGKDIKDKYCGGKGCLPAHVDTVNILGRDFKGGQMSRDMNLFVDTDAKAYLISASEENSTTHISQLTDDYLSTSGKYVRIFPNRYMEAGTIFKTSSGIYFFMASDCTGWSPNAARSAWTTNIFGPWTEIGNPATGPDSALTFRSQSTFILPYKGKKDAFIYMGDRWNPDNAIDGRYVWLPIKLSKNKFQISWMDKWDLEYLYK
ncbi:MAG: glycoside hydrolase family 43 protein [Bacteroidota bacterium]|nr:glycoside hydrolase family 43 protein [Bacteroidota bacterium]